MLDIKNYDPNSASNPNNNIFGLPFSEEESKVIILPVPWEVTVSANAGTSRTAEQIFKASLQVGVFDMDVCDGWKQGFYMREMDRKLLMKSDYLRKEAELYIDYITKGNDLKLNKFMTKSLKEINEGSIYLNNWVYTETSELLKKDKLIGLLGGDHSVSLGHIKALAEVHESFGILQIDAHCDLRKSFEAFNYSHASIMYNVLTEVPAIERVVQFGVRNLSEEEWDYVCNSNYRVITYLDKNIKERQFEGENWKMIVDELIEHLPQKVYLSFDVDGLDPKLCPHTSTPVPGGYDMEQVLYLVKRMIEQGKQLIGFDLVEIGVGEDCIDAHVGARLLWRLCNLLIKSNCPNNK